MKVKSITSAGQFVNGFPTLLREGKGIFLFVHSNWVLKVPRPTCGYLPEHKTTEFWFVRGPVYPNKTMLVEGFPGANSLDSYEGCFVYLGKAFRLTHKAGKRCKLVHVQNMDHCEIKNSQGERFYIFVSFDGSTYFCSSQAELERIRNQAEVNKIWAEEDGKRTEAYLANKGRATGCSKLVCDCGLSKSCPHYVSKW